MINPKTKLFGDDTSLFTVVHAISTSANELTSHLMKVSIWTFQWKISFNTDPSKQVPEIIFG